MSMTHIDHMDPFATSTTLGEEDNPERITGGRYRLPDLTVTPEGRLVTGVGPKKYGWQRVTNMVKAIAEARALDLWHQRMLLVGLAMREDLYDLTCSTLSGRKLDGSDPDLKADLEDLAGRILLAANVDVGANLGTAFHGFAEAQDAGMMHYARRRWHGRLSNYAQGLEAQRLRVIPALSERRVVILKYGLCGTLDRIVEDIPGACLRIGDLKSQKRFWTWLEISAQLAAYQMADAMWERSSLSYVDFPKVADDLAVVAWIPQVHPDSEEDVAAVDRVDFFNVDLEAGREVLAECHTVERMRARFRSKHQTIGLLRPLPSMTEVEAYARRLDGVETAREGSAVWAEIVAAGLQDTPELKAMADEAVARVTS
jgi:hypothetical protein